MAVALATLPWTPITGVGHRYMIDKFFALGLQRPPAPAAVAAGCLVRRV